MFMVYTRGAQTVDRECFMSRSREKISDIELFTDFVLVRMSLKQNEMNKLLKFILSTISML